ncbi:VOC family protein [Stackebrandtia soli]|uniref:VOC family protein n=1 Tax=Stackebrandtia soli TaxID=1892856 RepID=UPI0039E7B6E6
MTEQITPWQFHEFDGLDDWRVLFGGACAYFRTDSFETGVALIAAIGTLAEAANHHPDVDLRYAGVTVRMMTHEVDGLSGRDVELARQISMVAKELDIPAEPATPQAVRVSIDAVSIPEVMPFWRAVLGYEDLGDEELVDPRGRGPSIWFQRISEPREQRNRVHIDISVPHDQAEARVAAAVEAGGELVTDEHAPARWVLADAEGTEACVATWMGRD